MLTILQAERVEHALIEKSRAPFRLAGHPEDGLEVEGRPLEPIEAALLREAPFYGWMRCREEVISLLVALGREYERCSFLLQGLLREALIDLLTDRGEPKLRGSEGLRTGCEACGEVFPVKRPKGVLREIWWSDNALRAPPEAHFLSKGIEEQMGLVPAGRARFGVVWEPVPPGVAPHPSGEVRRVVTCPGCRRRRLGRCEHEAIRSGGWRRCGQLTTSSIYCEEHQEHRYRRARERDPRHRRVLPPSAVPPPTYIVNSTSSAAVRSIPLLPGALGA